MHGVVEQLADNFGFMIRDEDGLKRYSNKNHVLAPPLGHRHICVWPNDEVEFLRGQDNGQETALHVRVLTQRPTNQDVAEIAKWDGVVGHIFLNCGCSVLLKLCNFDTEQRWIDQYAVPGANVVFDVKPSKNRKTNEMGLIAFRIELLMPEGLNESDLEK